MKGLDTGKDKIQKICDTLRKETLEPAKQEAREIVENAHMQAAEIVKEAKQKASHMMQIAEKEMEEKKRVFQSSLNLACRQGIDFLKGRIEKEIFNTELAQMVKKEMADPKLIANLLNHLVKTLEEQGVEEELTVAIPKSISPRSINELLAARVLDKLQNRSVTIGDFEGGVQIQMKDRKITIDISDTVVRELIAQYIRRDFRDLLFQV